MSPEQVPGGCKIAYRVGRSLRKTFYAQVDMKSSGVVSQFIQKIPQGEGILSTGNGDHEAPVFRDSEFLHCPGHRSLAKSNVAFPAEKSVMAGQADVSAGSASSAFGIRREWGNDIFHDK